MISEIPPVWVRFGRFKRDGRCERESERERWRQFANSRIISLSFSVSQGRNKQLRPSIIEVFLSLRVPEAFLELSISIRDGFATEESRQYWNSITEYYGVITDTTLSRPPAANSRGPPNARHRSTEVKAKLFEKTSAMFGFLKKISI